MSTASEHRPSPLSIRPSEHQKQVIARAAKLQGMTVSNFVLHRAYADAQAVLADQARFELSASQWDEFVAALDAPPKDLPRLRKLLTEPGVFDG